MQNTGEFQGKLYNEADFPAKDEINAESTPDGVYHRVRFMGKFGIMCSQTQEFERYRISHAETMHMAETYFGTCRHTIVMFDQQGNVIEEIQGGIF